MRCSVCSAEVRPVVAIDIDGTLSDYHEHFIKFACNYFAIAPPLVPWDGSGEMEDHIDITKEQYREAKLAYRQGGGKRVQPMQRDARHLLFGARGSELWLTTTRPWMRLDSTDPDTRFWLEVNGVSYDHLLYDDDKYAALAERVDPERVVMVVDDLRGQCERAAAVFGQSAAWQVVRPHNEALEAAHPLRMSAEDLGVVMEVRLKEWRDAHR